MNFKLLPMTNVEKLKELRILHDIRLRMGADDENDTSVDGAINRLSNSQLVEKWAGWHLGTESWWITMKRYFDELEQMSIESEVKWIPISGNEELFNEVAKSNPYMKFDDGTVCRYDDHHPIAIATHFKTP